MTPNQRLPITVHLPASDTEPTEIQDHSLGLRMCLVEPASLARIDDSWERPSVLLLLGAAAGDKRFTVRVGRSWSGVRDQLIGYGYDRSWQKALLIQRDVGDGMSTRQVAWLQTHLIDVLHDAPYATVEGTADRVVTLAAYEERILSSLADPVVRVLRLMGYAVSLPSRAATSTPAPQKAPEPEPEPAPAPTPSPSPAPAPAWSTAAATSPAYGGYVASTSPTAIPTSSPLLPDYPAPGVTPVYASVYSTASVQATTSSAFDEPDRAPSSTAEPLYHVPPSYQTPSAPISRTEYPRPVGDREPEARRSHYGRPPEQPAGTPLYESLLTGIIDTGRR